MKFIIGFPKEQEKEEVKIFFWLEEHDGEIILKAQREDDDYSWNILTFGSSGLHRCVGVENDVGFPLDSKDRILLKE